MSFASKTLTEHVVRGVVGLGAILLAFTLALRLPWLSVLLVGVALAALRGCPMCWTTGLIETLHARLRGRAPDPGCTDGSCTRRRG